MKKFLRAVCVIVAIVFAVAAITDGYNFKPDPNRDFSIVNGICVMFTLVFILVAYALHCQIKDAKKEKLSL